MMPSEATDSNPVKADAAKRIAVFLADVTTAAGGDGAVAQALFEMGWAGREGGPFDERTVEQWRKGLRKPDPDLCLALSLRFGVSLDAQVMAMVAQRQHDQRLRVVDESSDQPESGK